MAVKRWHEDFQCKYHSTASVSAILSFPHCLGNSVCANGNQQHQNLYVPSIQRSKPRAECIYHTANCQFLLEPYFFQCTSICFCFHLVTAVMGLGFVDDPYFLPDRSFCSQTSDPISTLALFCCISELWCLVSESLASQGGRTSSLHPYL